MITLADFQKESLRRPEIGFFIRVWRRQAGKTTANAFEALDVMSRNPGILVPYASASIAVGAEMLLREAEVWYKIIQGFEQWANEKGMKLDSNGDGLSIDDFAEMFEAGKVEIRLHHSRTVVSRTKLVAPNPATARGYTGYVIIDEVGHIKDFIGLWDAMEAIASREPNFRVRMAGTPPIDDAHPFWALTAPPDGMTFPDANPRGHWYKSMAGVQIHRVDARDAHAAGIVLYDLETRRPMTPEEHRAAALDKPTWDRNYGLLHIKGGTAAYPLSDLSYAQQLGALLGVASKDGVPEFGHLLGRGKIALGLDPATTENKTSNPTGFAVVEENGKGAIVRCACRWKTSDPSEADDSIDQAIAQCGDREIVMVVDNSNERYYARQLHDRLRGRVRVIRVAANEKFEYGGESLPHTELSTNMLINDLSDGLISLPAGGWLADDFRLVYRSAGGFAKKVDREGNHADVQDGIRLARWGLKHNSGPAMARDFMVGANHNISRALKNRFAHRFSQKSRSNPC